MFNVKARIVEVMEDQKISNSVLRQVVFSTDGEKPKTIKIDFWNEKAALVTGKDINKVAVIEFDIESKPFNGKYYTNLKATSLTYEEDSNSENTTPSKKVIISPEIDVNDLPF